MHLMGRWLQGIPKNKLVTTHHSPPRTGNRSPGLRGCVLKPDLDARVVDVPGTSWSWASGVSPVSDGATVRLRYLLLCEARQSLRPDLA